MAKHVPHIFLTAEELDNKTITDDNFHHLVRVLRLQEASTFFALDNQGNRFNCKITTAGKKKACFEIISFEKVPPKDNKIILIVALLKTEKFEEIIDKATQLGVDEIIPFEAEFSSVAAKIYEKKYPRFQSIIKAAAEQSQRAYIPLLREIHNFEELLNLEKIIVAYEKATTPLKEVIRNMAEKRVCVLFGPEGGLSETEVRFLDRKGFPMVSLGNNILRAETAVISTLAAINYELDF